jgi:hypothetical protein
MANVFLSNVGASTGLNAVGTQFNAGFIALFSGAQPATANTNTSASNTLVAEVAFSSVAGSAAASTWTANALTATTAIANTTVVFFRATSSSRVAIIDGNVSTVGADMNFNTNNFASGASVAVTSFVLIWPEGPS